MTPLAQAISVSTGAVYLPAGVYNVTSADFAGAPVTGVKFYGDGWNRTILRAAPGQFIYDNAAVGMHGQFHTFTDIGFQGMDPTTMTGYASIPPGTGAFKVTSTGVDQSMTFTRCVFEMFDVMAQMAGTNNASENHWTDCKIWKIRTAVLQLNNPQSFNNEFVSTDVEQIYGDVFQVANGGAIKVTGGSWIMFSDTGVPTYFFRGTGCSGIGSYPNVFDKMRMELRGNFTNLANCANTQQFGLDFHNSLIEDQSAVTKPEWIVCGAYSTVAISGHAGGIYQIGGQELGIVLNGTGSYGQPGLVEFDSITAPNALQSWVTKPHGFGVARGRNLKTSAIGYPSPGPIADWVV